MATKNMQIRNITISAMLVVIYFITNRFLSISIPAFGVSAFMRLSFSCIAIIIGAAILGPIYGVAIGVIGDLISALTFPIGPYFPGYTLSYALVGLLSGLFFKYCKKHNFSDKFLFIINSIVESSLYALALYFLIKYDSIKISGSTIILSSSIKIILITIISLFYCFMIGLSLVFLLKKKKNGFYSFIKILFIYTWIEIICFFVLNSLWIYIMTKTIPFEVNLLFRIFKSFLTIPLIVSLMLPLFHVLEKRKIISIESEIENQIKQ